MTVCIRVCIPATITQFTDSIAIVHTSLTQLLLLTALTLGGLIYLPKYLKLWDPSLEMDEETNQLLKQASAMKRRRNARKNN